LNRQPVETGTGIVNWHDSPAIQPQALDKTSGSKQVFYSASRPKTAYAKPGFASRNPAEFKINLAMPPTSIAAAEAQILKSYLLNPASLPTIITLEEFRVLFPANQQSHPEVKLLYRDLQFLRTVDTDLVEENIYKECRDGERQRRELQQAFYQQPHLREQTQAQMQADKDVQADQVLYGPTGSVAKRKRGHSKESLVREMEDTIRYLEVDALVAKREADKLLGQLRETIGKLSGPRHSKLALVSGPNGDSKADEAVKSLESLESLEQALARNSATQ